MKQNFLLVAAVGVLTGTLLVLSSTYAQFTMPGPAAWAPAAAPPFACSNSTSKWNPSDNIGGTLSNSNCTVTAGSAASFNTVVRTTPTVYSNASGVGTYPKNIYFEVLYAGPDDGFWIAGVGSSTMTLAAGQYPGNGLPGLGLQLMNSPLWYTASGGVQLAVPNCAISPGPSSWVGFAIQFQTGEAFGWCTVNCTTWNATSSDNPTTGVGPFHNTALPSDTYTIALGAGFGNVTTINTGPTGFKCAVPSAYVPYASLEDESSKLSRRVESYMPSIH